MNRAIAEAEWASIAELEPRFGISRSTANRLIAAGLIMARKVGRRSAINLESVRNYIAAQPKVQIKQDDRAARFAAAAASRSQLGRGPAPRRRGSPELPPAA